MGLILGVPQLKGYFIALERLTEDEDPPKWKVRAKIKAVTYLTGYAIGLGFGLVPWCKKFFVLEAGKFKPLYHLLGKFLNP